MTNSVKLLLLMNTKLQVNKYTLVTPTQFLFLIQHVFVVKISARAQQVSLMEADVSAEIYLALLRLYYSTY